VDSELTPGFLDAIRIFNQKWFIAVRTALPSNPAFPLPNNTIWFHSFEPIIWFLKGALAGLFSPVNDFCIDIPRITTSQYIVGANFYYAGLKYANPASNLVAVNSLMPAFTERQAIQKCLQKVPNYKVHANFHSRFFYPALIEEYGLYSIENQVGVLSPQEDLDIMLPNRTLTCTNWLYLNVFKDIILRIHNGEDLGRKLFMLSESDSTPVVSLTEISPVVPNSVKKEVEKLQKKYLFKQDDDNPKLYCEPFLKNIIGETVLIPNDGCLDKTSILSTTVLHPDIPIYVIDP